MAQLIIREHISTHSLTRRLTDTYTEFATIGDFNSQPHKEADQFS